MATSANGTARVRPGIKLCPESILAETGGVPHPLPVPQTPTRDDMTDAQFDAMIEAGYRQAESGQTIPLGEAFTQVREGLE